MDVELLGGEILHFTVSPYIYAG